MPRPITSKLWFVVFLLCSAAFGQRRPMAPDPTSVSVAAMAPVAGAGYAGAERCQTCHNAEFGEFNKTHHAAIKPVQKDSVTGCEMCHGPGKAHADGEEASQGDDAKTAAASKLIFSFPYANPKQNAERCLVCHQSSRNQKDFTHSSHIQHGVDCSSCHSMHMVEAGRNPKAERLGTAQGNFFNVPKLPEESRWLHNSQLIKPQPELCYGCHGNIEAQFALPTHHRVPEGAIELFRTATNPRRTSTARNWCAMVRRPAFNATQRNADHLFSNIQHRRSKAASLATRRTAASIASCWSAARSVSCACSAT